MNCASCLHFDLAQHHACTAGARGFVTADTPAEGCGLYAPPLTDAERAELARLREWRANLGAYTLIRTDDPTWLRLLELERRAAAGGG